MDSQLVVMCLCAEWCGTCRAYRNGFEALAINHAEVSFQWVDIEEETEWPDALEVENFPTVMIRLGETVVFLGPILPQHAHLERMLETLGALSDEEARCYAGATQERRAWQAAADFRRR